LEGVAPGRAKLDGMSETKTTRTLVKSPPELWAECSDASSLARHLDQFGEIKITRLEPETAVAWEGERVSGTVEIESSGWGTRVTLTARVEAAAEPIAATEPVAGAAAVPQPESVPEPEPEPEPEPVAVAVLDAEPVAPSAPVAPPAPPPPPPRRGGLLARLFGRRPQPASAPELAPVAEPAPEPVVVAPEPEVAPEPVAAAPEPVVSQPPAPPAPPTPSVADELAELEPALSAALDSLGQAHHRPFSRS
jgi:hypothetical protein